MNGLTNCATKVAGILKNKVYIIPSDKWCKLFIDKNLTIPVPIYCKMFQCHLNKRNKNFKINKTFLTTWSAVSLT